MFKEYSNKVKKYLKEEDVPFKEYADKIKKWIKEEAYEFDERPDIETKLTIDIKEDKYTIISIAFHKDSLDSIIIAANMEFNEKEQNMLKSLKNRNEVVWDIRKFLIQMHLNPRFPIITDNIKELYFQKTLFFDNLTKDRFFEVLTDISNSISFIRGTFKTWTTFFKCVILIGLINREFTNK